MRFELTKEYLQAIETAIESNDTSWITENILELHDADIAAIIGELDHEYATDLFNRIPSNRKGDILIELDDDSRDHLLKGISAIDLANQLESLDSDDAADLISELSANEIEEVISHISDNEAAGDIVDLLNYDEDTAGGLMQKEFIKAKMDWPVNRCVVELRRQAEEVEKVYTIYVVDDDDKLVGFLSLKRLLFASPKTKIADLYQSKNIISVKTSEDD